jgi:hypothetical protein
MSLDGHQVTVPSGPWMSSVQRGTAKAGRDARSNEELDYVNLRYGYLLSSPFSN